VKLIKKTFPGLKVLRQFPLVPLVWIGSRQGKALGIMNVLSTSYRFTFSSYQPFFIFFTSQRFTFFLPPNFTTRSRYSDWLRPGLPRVGVRVPVGSRILSSQYLRDRLWGPPSLLYSVYRG
jgi:hypothetical protein